MFDTTVRNENRVFHQMISTDKDSFFVKAVSPYYEPTDNGCEISWDDIDSFHLENEGYADLTKLTTDHPEYKGRAVKVLSILFQDEFQRNALVELKYESKE